MLNFKPVFIEATTLSDAWFQCLYQVWHKGRKYKISSGSMAGATRLAFDYVAGFISHPHERPLAPIMPEGLGVGAPTTDEKIEEYFANYLMDPELAENEEYKYATWLRGGLGNKYYHDCPIDQVRWTIEHFEKHGLNNEHCCMTIGNALSSIAYDQTYKNCPEGCENDKFYPHEVNNCPECGKELVKNEALRGTTPCLRILDYRIIDGYLTTHVVYRSWDLFSGFSCNMGGFTLVNEYIAEHLPNVKPGPLSFSCKSLHCYDTSIEPLKSLLKIQD